MRFTSIKKENHTHNSPETQMAVMPYCAEKADWVPVKVLLIKEREAGAGPGLPPQRGQERRVWKEQEVGGEDQPCAPGEGEETLPHAHISGRNGSSETRRMCSGMKRRGHGGLSL